MADVDPQQQISVEDDQGRVLSGVGVAESSLQEVIDGRDQAETTAPAEEQPPAPSVAPSGPAESGKIPPRGNARFQYYKHLAETSTKQAEDIQAKLAAAEQRATELEARLTVAPAAPIPTAQAQAVTAQADRTAAQQTQTGADPTRPQPSEDDIGGKYKTYAEFVADTARWVVEQQQVDVDSRITAALAADRHMQAFGQRINEAWTKGRAAYPDFDTVLSSATVVFPGPVLQAIADAPSSEHLQYRLAKDPALSQQIAGEVDPIRIGMMLQALASPSSPAAAPASVRTAQSSTAPPPYQPVGSRAKTTSPTLEELAAAGDYEGYRALKRRAQS